MPVSRKSGMLPRTAPSSKANTMAMRYRPAQALTVSPPQLARCTALGSLCMSEPRNRPSWAPMECRSSAQLCQLSPNRIRLYARRTQSLNVADGVCLVNLPLRLRESGCAPFFLATPGGSVRFWPIAVRPPGEQESGGLLFRYPRPWGWLAAKRPGSLCLGAVHSATGVGIPRRPCLFATASSCRPPSNPRWPPSRRQSHTVIGRRSDAAR